MGLVLLFSALTQHAAAEQTQLPVDADRCAIALALVGAPADGCAAPNVEDLILRSLDQAEPGAKTGGYSVHFPFDSKDIDQGAQEHLQRLSAVLNEQLGNLCILLVGHADTVGSADYNLGLSENRALSVRLYLAGPGRVGAGRLRTHARGEADPLPDIPGADPRNRRVEVLAKRATVEGCT